MMILMVEFWLEITSSQERYYSQKCILHVTRAGLYLAAWAQSQVCPLESEIRINSSRNGQYNDQTSADLGLRVI